MGVSDWRLVGTAVLAGLLTFASHVALHRVRRAIRVFDAVGLAFFCVTGSLKALTLGAGPLTAVIVGVVTAAGGGVMRDVVAGQVPEVLRRVESELPPGFPAPLAEAVLDGMKAFAPRLHDAG